MPRALGHWEASPQEAEFGWDRAVLHAEVSLPSVNPALWLLTIRFLADLCKISIASTTRCRIICTSHLVSEEDIILISLSLSFSPCIWAHLINGAINLQASQLGFVSGLQKGDGGSSDCSWKMHQFSLRAAWKFSFKHRGFFDKASEPCFSGSFAALRPQRAEIT